jgi:hypothetical protein
MKWPVDGDIEDIRGAEGDAAREGRGQDEEGTEEEADPKRHGPDD